MTKNEAEKLIFTRIGRGLQRDRLWRETQEAEQKLADALVTWQKATMAEALARMIDET